MDTSVLIAVERGLLDLKKARTNDELGIATIVVSELLHGAHRAQTARQRARRESLLAELLITARIFPFDLAVARTHSQIWADLSSRGTVIGAHDLIIGATALHHGAKVATRDRRSFPRIKGLGIVDW